MNIPIQAFAMRRHNMDRYGGQSYSKHLAAVDTVLIETGYGTDALRAAAWLHDTIKDTGTTRGEIETLAGVEVADLVWAVTGIGPNRRARNKDILRKLAVHPTAWPLKLADRIANLEQTARTRNVGLASMYLEERGEFDAAIHGDYLTTKIYERLIAAYDKVNGRD